MNILYVAMVSGLLVGTAQAQASSDYFVSIGAGKTFDGGAQALDSVRLAFGRHRKKNWFVNDALVLGGFWEFSAVHFESELDRGDPGVSLGGETNLDALAASFVFRLQPSAQWTVTPFAEFGIGAAFVSDTDIITDDYDGHVDLGSAFQFEDRIAVGLKGNIPIELVFSVFHYSNGGLKLPNDGINFHELKVTWRY